jgi:hypothetical protein
MQLRQVASVSSPLVVKSRECALPEGSSKPLWRHNPYAGQQASRMQPQHSSNPLLTEARRPWHADRRPPPPADGTRWTASGICRFRSLRSLVRSFEAHPSIKMARGLLGAYSWRRRCYRKQGHRSCKYECKRQENKGLHGRTPNSLARDTTIDVFRPDFVGHSISFQAVAHDETPTACGIDLLTGMRDSRRPDQPLEAAGRDLPPPAITGPVMTDSPNITILCGFPPWRIHAQGKEAPCSKTIRHPLRRPPRPRAGPSCSA